MRKYLIIVGLWIAKLGGWTEPVCSHAEQGLYTIKVDSDLFQSAKMFVTHVEEKFSGHSGEFKRSQVLRALLNRHPECSERDASKAIEAAVELLS